MKSEEFKKKLILEYTLLKSVKKNKILAQYKILKQLF